MIDNLNFDRWQFENLHCYAKSVDFNESTRMQTRARRGFRNTHEVPLWIFNDKKLRAVIARHIAKIACTETPKDFASLQIADRLALKRLRTNRSTENRTLAKRAGRIGSLAAYFLAIIFWTYRCGYESPVVADLLHTSPLSVRQSIYRLKKTAARLDAGTFVLRCASVVKKSKYGAAKIRVAEARKLRVKGWTWQALADRYRVSYFTIWNVLHRAAA